MISKDMPWAWTRLRFSRRRESPKSSPLGAFSVLPLELRQQIWTYLLPPPLDYFEMNGVIIPSYRFLDMDNDEYQWLRESNALHYNRAIYQEASAALYDCTLAFFTLRSLHDANDDVQIQHPTLPEFKRSLCAIGERPTRCNFQDLAKIPWHRFKEVQIRVHVPEDFSSAVRMRQLLNYVSSILHDCASSLTGSSKLRVTVYFKPAWSSGKLWQDRLDPQLTDEGVAWQCPSARSSPAVVALASMTRLIQHPNICLAIDTNHEPSTESALRQALRVFESAQLLESRISGRSQLNLWTRSGASESPLRTLERHMAAAQTYLLDHTLGEEAAQLREAMYRNWSQPMAQQALADIEGHPHADAYRFAVRRRYLAYGMGWQRSCYPIGSTNVLLQRDRLDLDSLVENGVLIEDGEVKVSQRLQRAIEDGIMAIPACLRVAIDLPWRAETFGKEYVWEEEEDEDEEIPENRFRTWTKKLLRVLRSMKRGSASGDGYGGI